MPVVEGDAEDLGDGGVPGALHVVDALRDEVEVEEFVRVGVVEEAVGGAPFVGEESVGFGGVDGKIFPLGEVGRCGLGEVCCGDGVVG